MDRRALRRKVFELFCEVADGLYALGSENYDCLASVGKGEEVAEHSEGMLDKKQLAHRLGLQVGEEYPELSVFTEADYATIRNSILHMVLKKNHRDEVDGGLVFSDDGMLLLGLGTRAFSCDYRRLRKARGSRLEAGVGRSSLAYVSLTPGVAGVILRTDGTVAEYRSGWKSKSYSPSGKECFLSGEIVEYRKGKEASRSGRGNAFLSAPVDRDYRNLSRA